MEDWDEEDHALLQEAKDAALAYISSFAWCPEISSAVHTGGVPGIVSIFLATFLRPVANSLDDQLWIIVGDLPTAHLVVEKGDGAREALSTYCDLMSDWILAVRTKSDLEEVFPVRADPTEEMAAMLESRIAFLRDRIIETLD